MVKQYAPIFPYGAIIIYLGKNLWFDTTANSLLQQWYIYLLLTHYRNTAFRCTKDIYTEPQKKCHTKKYNSHSSLHLYNEIVCMCNDKILVQR